MFLNNFYNLNSPKASSLALSSKVHKTHINRAIDVSFSFFLVLVSANYSIVYIIMYNFMFIAINVILTLWQETQ